MTWMIHSIAFRDIQDEPQAAFYFRKSWEAYVRGPFYVWHEGANMFGGVPNFINAAGMLIMNVVAGYGGVRLKQGHIELNRPVPPPNCTKLVLRRVYFRGAYLNIEADTSGWSVGLDQPAPPGLRLKFIAGDYSTSLNETVLHRKSGTSAKVVQH